MTGAIVAISLMAGSLLALPPTGTTGRPTRATWAAVAVVVGVLASRVVLAAPVVPLVLGFAVALALAHQVRRRRRGERARRRRDSAIEACAALTSELQAGRSPVAALRAVAEDWSELAPVADAALLGSDVPTAWRLLAERPGAGSLRWVAAAWAIAHRSGAGLSGAVNLATRAMEDERSTARVLETELASARATARLLAVLPFGVLLIGRGAGGDPFGFLLNTVPGWICLALGLLLAWGGLLWIERIGAESG